MSSSFSPSRELIQRSMPQVEPLFTTFASGHFVKPGQHMQPVKPVAVKTEVATEVVVPTTFSGCFTEFYAAAPIDLDYEEPNAVVEADLEFIQAGNGIHQMELAVTEGNSPSDNQTVEAEPIDIEQAQSVLSRNAA